MSQLTQAKRQMLVSIAQAPRSIRHFTHGQLDVPLSSASAQYKLDQLTESGHLVLDGEQYSLTVKGRQALDAYKLPSLINGRLVRRGEA